MPHFRTLLCLAFLAVPGALAAQDPTQDGPKVKRNPDLISAQEIEAAPDAIHTAFDLVKQLRPMWLTFRGPTSIRSSTPTAQVYVDGVRRNGPTSLTEVSRGLIREIRHLRGTDATQRFGLDHENGAILVITK